MIDGVNKIGAPNPERIRQARIARGMTQSELGERIGMTRQSISQYEKGSQCPSHETMDKLHEELSFPVAFFYGEDSYEHVAPIFFRRFKTAHVKKQDAIQVRILWLCEIIMYLIQFIKFVKFNVYETKERCRPYSYYEIEKIADNARLHWGLGLGPISNMTLLLENNGFFISKFEFEARELDACSSLFVHGDECHPLVFLSGSKSAVRSRFDAAHELGHVILHNWVDQEYALSKGNYDRLEDEANYFAGAFLMPRDTISREGHSLSSIDSYLSLKKRWGVSIQALIHRFKNLGMINDLQYSYLYRQINFRGYRITEPFDEKMRHELPQVLREAIELLRQNGMQTMDAVREKIPLPEEEFAMLIGGGFPKDDQKPYLKLIKS